MFCVQAYGVAGSCRELRSRIVGAVPMFSRCGGFPAWPESPAHAMASSCPSVLPRMVGLRRRSWTRSRVLMEVLEQQREVLVILVASWSANFDFSQH
jgi:hypothetical protein